MATDDPRAVLRYLRRCYEASCGSRLIDDIFAKKIDTRIFLDDLPQSADASSPVDSDFLRGTEYWKLAARAEAYQTEMRLLLPACRQTLPSRSTPNLSMTSSAMPGPWRARVLCGVAGTPAGGTGATCRSEDVS